MTNERYQDDCMSPICDGAITWHQDNDADWTQTCESCGAVSERGGQPELVCPAGHVGPWRFVEAIYVWREVLSIVDGKVNVMSRWQTDEGYNDGEPVDEPFECRAREKDGSYCGWTVKWPDWLDVEWW